MKIVLATGIYPPDIGGPATYVSALREEMMHRGHEVVVVTYGEGKEGIKGIEEEERSDVVVISKSGGSLMRWWSYAKALKRLGGDADVVIAFSSVSCGVPLWLAGLKKPKKYLRLGGDFLWERYTDRGGELSLNDYYHCLKKRLAVGYERLAFFLMRTLLSTFDALVFSTRMQEELYEEYYPSLPPHSVIENALPTGIPMPHAKHDGLRLLFMGRFVGFKNISALIESLVHLDPSITLTLTGGGPMKSNYENLIKKYHLEERVVFLPPAHGEEKLKIFSTHDVLIIPSMTEISPNVALEARASGLPVLLTSETGLSKQLTQGMLVRDLRTPKQIATAVDEVMHAYDRYAKEAASLAPERGWEDVTDEWLELISE